MGGGLAILAGTAILYGLKKVTDQAKVPMSFMALKAIAGRPIDRLNIRGCLCLGLLVGRRPDQGRTDPFARRL